MTSLDLAKHYFQLSNESNFEEITKMFRKSSTFRSGKGELFLGSDSIMAMQRKHHGMYKSLDWKVLKVIEPKPGIITFVFDFTGITQAGECVEYSGVEDVIIYDGKIQHIQVSLS